VRAFTEKQVGLVSNFAAQAVIAIENTRLLNELRESLEQQTATSEVLGVISSSPGDLGPVFQAMLDNAVRICGAKFGNMFRYENGEFYSVARLNMPPAIEEYLRKRGRRPPRPGSVLDQMWKAKRVIHTLNDTASPSQSTPALLGGARTHLSVPMLKDDELVGAITIYRTDVRPFTDKQIELVQNFASQAVIAIENTRLLNELRQRTDDLTESLEQQTATSDVLRVISTSPGELEPVFNSILESATRVCQAGFGTLFRHDGELFHRVAGVGTPPAFVEFQRQRGPFNPEGSGTILDRVVRTKAVVHVEDGRATASLEPPVVHGGARSMVGVPMLKDRNFIGAIVIYRQEVRPFSEKQIALVQNFAAQAVIAIENTRLLNELRQRTDDLTESLEQQTATSEVLKVISSSPGELDAVFATILENATGLCEAKFGNFWLSEGDTFRGAALHNAPAEYADYRQRNPVIRPGPEHDLRQMATTRQAVQLEDVRAVLGPDAPLASLAGARTVISVPMIKDDQLIGGLGIYRQEVRPFTGKQIELLTNFAAQAVIAIENARLLNELRESLEHQTATGEVLGVISRSPTDTQPVFDAIAESAAHLCDAVFTVVWLYDGELLHYASNHNFTAEVLERIARSYPRAPDRSLAAGRAILDGKIAHVPDMLADPAYDHEMAMAGNWRASIAVPMLRDGRSIGAISAGKADAGPYTERQMQLLTTFADQAVIAIENVRLFNELQQRTDDLTESLEQQTATSEVLKVISGSPGELDPVFQSMLANAMRICEAKFGILYEFGQGQFRAISWRGVPPAYADYVRQRRTWGPHTGLGQVARTRQVVHTPDVVDSRAYVEGDPERVATVELGGVRTALVVPMLKEGELAGAFVIFRQEVKPFTGKQIELVQTFAAQAVIAVENTRLLNELRQRTDDLSESLEQQTATSEVLKIISSSPGELEPVFDSILENAVRICEATFGNLVLYDAASGFRVTALHGANPQWAEVRRRQPNVHAGPMHPFTRILETRELQHIPDMRQDPAYLARDPSLLPFVDTAGARTNLIVPMLKDRDLVGLIAIYRKEVRPYTDKQIELVKSFAAQAVIAIENTRLLNEIRESLQQQTATADVLKVISRSTFDLQTVLDTLVESANRLCYADRAAIRLLRDGRYHNVADCGFSPEHRERMRREPLAPGTDSMVGRVLLKAGPVHIVDAQTDPDAGMARRAASGGVHSLLGVPLSREGKPIGVLYLQRTMIRPYTDKQIELATTFADQAVIAIENVRLFDEIQEKSHQLAEASQHKSQFLANMSHELRTPLNAILGYTELIADGIYGAPPEKMQAVLKRVESNGRHLLGLINAVLDLSKIEAGQLTLDLADYSLQNVAQTVYNAVEPLASDKKLSFKADIEPGLPAGRGDERRLTQVLLNLVGNAIKFTDAGEVVIRAGAENGDFHFSVCDTGPGISASDQARLFQEFQQAANPATQKKEGTGLGLAISKRIIEMHGGRIWIESQPGQGSTFFVTVPVQVPQQVKPPGD
jgi:GAF domain-containing protein